MFAKVEIAALIAIVGAGFAIGTYDLGTDEPDDILWVTMLAGAILYFVAARLMWRGARLD
jgi:hypothetical protein